MCQRNGNGSKDIQILVITDTHGENLAVENAVKTTNGFDTIDVLLHCGDIVGSGFHEKGYVDKTFIPTLKKCQKPWFIVVGNHDVGNTRTVIAGATHQEVFDTYIKPMVENNVLSGSEYSDGKCYYYHDFTKYKIRLIVLYEYDTPIGVEDLEDNDYWDAIDFDSTLSKMENGKTYNVGDKVNCSGYTNASFVCKKQVTVSDNQYQTAFTVPFYKTDRSSRIIRDEQANWFINTLNSVPESYGVIVACHNPAVMNSLNQKNCKFAMNKELKAIEEGQYHMKTDIVSDIVNAWINKTILNENVICDTVGWNNGDASYLNSNTDTSGEKYYYSIKADFTKRNENSYFACYICGHTHKDLIFKDVTSGTYCINPICGITEYANTRSADVARPYGVDNTAYDALTSISVRRNRIAMARIGNDSTINGTKRDFEIINT